MHLQGEILSLGLEIEYLKIWQSYKEQLFDICIYYVIIAMICLVNMSS